MRVLSDGKYLLVEFVQATAYAEVEQSGLIDFLRIDNVGNDEAE